jgi:hypothetical protein
MIGLPAYEIVHETLARLPHQASLELPSGLFLRAGVSVWSMLHMRQAGATVGRPRTPL